MCETFNIVDFNPYQEEAIVYFLDKKMDGFVIFVNLPTGFGRSLIHRSLPLVSRSFRLVWERIVPLVSAGVHGRGKIARGS